MIHVDTPHPNADKKRRFIKNIQIQPNSQAATKSGTMTIPLSARKPSHHNKWDAVMSKMAETKHRPINVKDVKSKVFINTKVNLIPSHPAAVHRVQEKEQQDPLIKVMNPGKGGGKLVPRTKPDRNRLPKLVKESYSSQSSTLSSSSEDQHSHHPRQSRLLKQSSSTSCTSTGTVISPSCRSPTTPSTTKSSSVHSSSKQPQVHSAKSPSGFTSPQEIQSLQAELSREREARDRIHQENKTIKTELKALLESHEVLSLERQTLELELSSAGRRLQEARSDWDREREHAREESDANKAASARELQKLSQTHQIALDSLREAHQAEVEALKSINQSDLNQLRTTFEFREIEREQKYEFEIEELKAKHSEELENLESHYKVEIELHQHKLKTSYHPNYSVSPGSKENATDLLNKEITSLTVVVELRNNEIKDLRQEVMSQRLELERLHGVDDQNHQLVQRVEDLQAQVQKTRNDRKKLIVENQTMQTSMHEAVTAKEKLSMELDFLRYRMETTETDGIESPKIN